MAVISRLMTWVDAAYATHPDSRSRNGYCFELGLRGTMFYFRSSKQSVVTLSSTEAEIVRGLECTKEMIWFRNQIAELGFSQVKPAFILSDNSLMITLTTDFLGNNKRPYSY